MVATRPWTEFVAESDDEPTVSVDLTIREMSLALSCVDIDHVWDDYAVGFGLHRKFMAAIQTLMRSHDTKLVSKMMQAPPAGSRGALGTSNNGQSNETVGEVHSRRRRRTDV